MSSITKEWTIFFSFFVLVAGVTFFEAVWLKRAGRSGFGNALGFSVLTNFLGFTVGFFVLFVIVGVIMAMAWDGSIYNFPLKDYGLAVTLGFTFLFTPAWLALCKRFFSSLLKIQTGKSAWLYAIASSVLTLTICVGIPILLGWLLWR
jgi:hypothetical protein